MTPELRYFRDQAVVREFLVPLSIPKEQYLPADPLRYAIVVWNDSAADLFLYFGLSDVSGTAQMRVPPGSGPIVLSEDNVGELVRLTLSGVDAAGSGATVVFTTVSYCTYRYEQMQRYIHGRLSEYISL